MICYHRNYLYYLFTVKPLSVKLLGENRPLSAEAVYKIQCETIGAKPEPKVTWWKGSLQLRNSEEKV